MAYIVPVQRFVFYDTGQQGNGKANKDEWQEEFAELLGTTKQNISRYESGAVSPKITTAAIMAEQLGITLSELSGGNSSAKEKLNAIGEQITAPSRSKEWKALSEGFEKMEQQRYDEFMAIFNMLKATKPEYFNEGDKDDDNT